jgi:hypothetical protein
MAPLVYLLLNAQFLLIVLLTPKKIRVPTLFTKSLRAHTSVSIDWKKPHRPTLRFSLGSPGRLPRALPTENPAGARQEALLHVRNTSRRLNFTRMNRQNIIPS